MLKVQPLEEVLKSHPDFKPQWVSHPDGGMENPKFGNLSHVVVCKEDGTPLFDQYMIEETPGAVIIPYDNYKGVIRVGLLTAERFIPGKTYIEAPRGFGKAGETELETAYRELFEETGLSPEGVTILGKINPNTAFYREDGISVVAAKFDKLEHIENPGEQKLVEKIKNISPYNFNELREHQKSGSLECGITKAALFEFGLFMPEFYKK